MDIVCDECRKNNVEKNGTICEDCKKFIEESKIDRSYQNEIYLPTELFDKFKKLHDQVDTTQPDTMRAFRKFVKTLGTSFINHLTGKEINDPTPRVIIPKERQSTVYRRFLTITLPYMRHNMIWTLLRIWTTLQWPICILISGNNLCISTSITLNRWKSTKYRPLIS